jgi:arginyl-tRNA synthetase
MKVKEHIATHLREACRRLVEDLGPGGFSPEKLPPVILEKPRDPSHGDVATGLAMALAKIMGHPPREIAGELVKRLQFDSGLVSRVEVAGPGFINFTLGREWLVQSLRDVLRQGESYGTSSLGQGRRVQVEFVSANPTGPLVVVNGRAAAVGDSLVRLLKFAGYDAHSEYYIDDGGTQVEILARSVDARYRQVLGEDAPLPPDGYPGEYLMDLARAFRERRGPELAELSAQERVLRFREWSVAEIVAWQKRDLQDYGVTFDVWAHEADVRRSGRIEHVVGTLREKGYAYDADGALWLKTSLRGDEKDRVLIRSSGEPTYLLPDIVYHLDKFDRGFEEVIDLWGPDHQGHILPMEVALEALGRDPKRFRVLTVQWVTMIRGGERLSMSKRAGEFITLRELLDEVGRDAARFFFLLRRTDSHLDFDLDLAKRSTDENPVFYVQYAHARLCNILGYAARLGIGQPGPEDADLTLLWEPEETALAKYLVSFPELIEGAARDLEPHRLTAFLLELAGRFHAFYHHHRVVTEDTALTQSRLYLIQALRAVFRNGLTLLGVSAPETM